MNLQKLFDAQIVLDERIVKEKGLSGQDLLPNKILALQVELGELANEWRGFKHWSNDQKPRTTKWGECFPCNGTGTLVNSKYEEEFCRNCDGKGIAPVDGNPLLEEYVDCLHFIFSIAHDLGLSIDDLYTYDDELKGTTTEVFIELIYYVGKLIFTKDKQDFRMMMFLFSNFGEKRLGFTFEEIEQAYFEKNKVNHERQATGY